MKSFDALVGEVALPASVNPGICISAVFVVASVSACRFHSVYVGPARGA